MLMTPMQLHVGMICIALCLQKRPNSQFSNMYKRKTDEAAPKIITSRIEAIWRCRNQKTECVWYQFTACVDYEY